MNKSTLHRAREMAQVIRGFVLAEVQGSIPTWVISVTPVQGMDLKVSCVLHAYGPQRYMQAKHPHTE